MGLALDLSVIRPAAITPRQLGEVSRAARLALLSAASFGVLAMATPVYAQSDDPNQPQAEKAKAADTANADEIVVTGVTAPTTSSTGLPLKFMETPQSVTIIDQKRIQDYALTSSKELLKQVVGLTVEDQETDRTTFTARGFDVTNFQVDGIGLPLIDNIFYGDTDSFLYDRIDIIRGANGLTTGIGNPSATINYVRKRPLDSFHGTAAVYGGSWDKWRAEVDISTPINEDWAVRGEYAHEESNSYLDKYHYHRNVAGLTISGHLTPDLTLTAGYSYDKNYSHSSSWVGLWLFYSDGTPISYKRSENEAPRWAVWPTTQHQAFGELAYTLGDWTVKGIVNYRIYLDDPVILNPTGNPDRETGFYLGDTSQFRTRNHRVYGDLIASGGFHALGQDHKLTFGFSYSHSNQKGYQGRAVDTGYGLGAIVLPNFNGPDRFDPAEPDYNPETLAESQVDKLLRGYVASQINLTKSLHVVGGASWAKIQSSGFTYGQVLDVNESKVNPYVGVLYDLTSSLTAYASYTTIFVPQNLFDINHNELKPLDGTNLEAGLKANLFNGRFYATATAFKTVQKGLGRLVGQVPDPVYGNFFYYEAVGRTTAKGVELEMTGRVTPNWELAGGFTALSIKDRDTPGRARDFIPRKSLKMSTTYTFPELRGLSVGAQVRYQNKVKTGLVTEGAFAILDLQTGIDIAENLRASLVVRNVTNKLYFTSLVYGDYGIGQYAAPRNFTASLAYKF